MWKAYKGPRRRQEGGQESVSKELMADNCHYHEWKLQPNNSNHLRDPDMFNQMFPHHRLSPDY